MSSDDEGGAPPAAASATSAAQGMVDHVNDIDLLARLPPEFLDGSKPLFPKGKKATNVDELFLYSMCMKVSQEEKVQFLAHYDKFGGSFKALHAGLKIVQAAIPEFDFFDVILPAMQRAVLELKQTFASSSGGATATLQIIRQHDHKSCTLTRSEIFILNCAAFLGLLGEPRNARCGELNWMSVLTSTSAVGAARIACQLAYFHAIVALHGDLQGLRELENDPEVGLRHRVVFQRISRSGEGAFPNWSVDESVILESGVNTVVISDDCRIEDFAHADAHVDFANMQIHIGKIIPSATQEEVIFSIRPDLFPSIILFETLLDHEAVLVHGARRYCEYNGYAQSFRFKSLSSFPAPHEVEHIPIISVIDAHVNDGREFAQAMCDRDLNKAFAGFGFLKPGQPHLPLPNDGCEAPVSWPTIATGGWGCGIFQGNQVLKFVQQLMAARVGKAELLYSTFGSTDRCNMLKTIAFKLAQKKVTVGSMHRLILEYNELEETGNVSTRVGDDGEEVPLDFELFLLGKLQAAS